MRRAACLAALALPLPALAADPPAPLTPEQEVIALDDAWVAAEVSRDRAALERIIDPHALFTYPSGKTIGREAFIDGIMAANLKPYTVRHEAIVISGDTAQIIDASEDGAMKFVWIAAKRDGAWRAMSEVFVRVAQPEATAAEP